MKKKVFFLSMLVGRGLLKNNFFILLNQISTKYLKSLQNNKFEKNYNFLAFHSKINITQYKKSFLPLIKRIKKILNSKSIKSVYCFHSVTIIHCCEASFGKYFISLPSSILLWRKKRFLSFEKFIFLLFLWVRKEYS